MAMSASRPGKGVWRSSFGTREQGGTSRKERKDPLPRSPSMLGRRRGAGHFPSRKGSDRYSLMRRGRGGVSSLGKNDVAIFPTLLESGETGKREAASL